MLATFSFLVLRYNNGGDVCHFIFGRMYQMSIKYAWKAQSWKKKCLQRTIAF